MCLNYPAHTCRIQNTAARIIIFRKFDRYSNYFRSFRIKFGYWKEKSK